MSSVRKAGRSEEEQTGGAIQRWRAPQLRIRGDRDWAESRVVKGQESQSHGPGGLADPGPC